MAEIFFMRCWVSLEPTCGHRQDAQKQCFFLARHWLAHLVDPAHCLYQRSCFLSSLCSFTATLWLDHTGAQSTLFKTRHTRVTCVKSLLWSPGQKEPADNQGQCLKTPFLGFASRFIPAKENLYSGLNEFERLESPWKSSS